MSNPKELSDDELILEVREYSESQGRLWHPDASEHLLALSMELCDRLVSANCQLSRMAKDRIDG